MATLALLLTGPMQAWGVRSASARKRDTARHPSRSGVIGLLAAAQGLDRLQLLNWARGLEMHVRVDSPGRVMSDYHTTGGGYTGEDRMRSAGGKRRDHASVSRRDYLADAAFVVALGGDRALLEQLSTALQAPTFALFLGRKSCPPGLPLLVGVNDEQPMTVLATIPAYRKAPRPTDNGAGIVPGEVTFDDLAKAAATKNAAQLVTCRVYVENPDYATATINDVPETFNHWSRTYATRSIGEEQVDVPRAGRGLDGLIAMRDAVAGRSR